MIPAAGLFGDCCSANRFLSSSIKILYGDVILEDTENSHVLQF